MNYKEISPVKITPDTCRLWDAAINEKLDKDSFRFDLVRVDEACAGVRNRYPRKITRGLR